MRPYFTKTTFIHNFFIFDELNVYFLEFLSGFGQFFVVKATAYFEVMSFTNLFDVGLLHDLLKRNQIVFLGDVKVF